jgi:hypothetical protein
MLSDALVRREVERAALDALRIDSRWPSMPEASAAICAAQERAAVMLEGSPLGGPSGLVSVPTSGKRRSHEKQSPAVLEQSADAMRALDGFALDPVARRLAELRMHVGFAARAICVTPAFERGEECLMVTLTYAGTNEDWSPRHVSDFLKNVREYMRRRGWPCRYVWVAELQKRGVIHYHVAVWVPQGEKLPKPDEQGWWPHGMTRIEVARAAVPYLLKYLSKDTSKTFGEFPKGARIYGVGGLDKLMRLARAWLRLPKFIQQRASIVHAWARYQGRDAVVKLSGIREGHDRWARPTRTPVVIAAAQRVGGWVNRATGEWLPSEFVRRVIAGVPAMVRLHRHPPEIDASGPFSWVGEACPRFACERGLS